MLVNGRESRAHRVHGDVRRVGAPPPFEVVERDVKAAVARPAHASLHADRPRVAPGFVGGRVDDGTGFVEVWAGRHHREPAVGAAAGTPVRSC